MEPLKYQKSIKINPNTNPYYRMASMQRVEAVLDRWLYLQKIIKEEITLNEIISKQQQNSLDALKAYYNEYYNHKLKIRETFENVINIDTNNFNLNYFDLSEEGEKCLLEVYEPIQKLLFLLRNDFQYVLKIISLIDEGENAKENSINTLVDLFCHQFYENVLIPNPEHEELLILCYLLLEKEIEGMNSASVSSFIEESTTFLGKFLKSYTKRQELKTYLSVTLGSLILEIENSAESCIDLNPGKILTYLKEKKMSPVDKSYNAEKSKDIFTDSEILTRKIARSRIRNAKAIMNNLGNENIITFTLKLGTSVNTQVPQTSGSSFNDLLMDPDYFLAPGELKIEDEEEYNKDYEIDITQDELTERIQKETDENLKEFYLRQLSRINKDPEIFTNKKFLMSLREYKKDSMEILGKFKENFCVIKDLIDSIIRSLIENISTIPYTLRCICKVINTLIMRKFPYINKYERNAFIGEFIFGKCILPILINSDINTVITSTILSLNTRQCLKIIAKVLTKINRGIFFEGNIDTEFTIFNHYIIEVIPEINKFYENLIDVTLPHVLDELINKNINGYSLSKYDYFAENVDELVNIQCICFSIQDILLLLKLIKPKIQQFARFQLGSFFIKTIEKISNQESFLNSVVNKHALRNFFLIYKIEMNPHHSDANNTQLLKFDFSNQIESAEIVLKRIKFCVRLILRGLNLINNKVYSYLNQAISTQNFFIALNQILQLEEFTDTEFNDKIPLNWYSLYMISNLQFLDDVYKKNDYEKLYKELLTEENTLIEFLKNKSNLVITKYGMNTRCVEKIIEKAKRDFIRIKQIEKFMKMEKFINKSKIEVCVRYNNKDEELASTSRHVSIFDNIFFWNKRRTITNNSRGISDADKVDSCTILIKTTDKCFHKRLQYIEKLTEGKPEKKSSKGRSKQDDNKVDCHANTIREFIKVFGKFKEILEDIVKGDQQHKIYQSLFRYSQIIKEHILKDDLFKRHTDEEIEEILEGIENYIMKKLYKVIYPKEELDKDILFYERACQLSWITPSHLEIKKAYLNENLWVLAINCVNKMDQEKTAFDKLRCISSAHKIINNCIKFCSGKDDNAGADDLAPIFQFIILKAKPRRMFSNINFIKSLVHPNKLSGFMGLLLCQMESAAEFIFQELNHEKLKMSKEEFDMLMFSSASYQ